MTTSTFLHCECCNRLITQEEADRASYYIVADEPHCVDCAEQRYTHIRVQGQMKRLTKKAQEAIAAREEAKCR